MASDTLPSTAFSSSLPSSSAPTTQDVRQAAPLPSKRGEIGYREEEHGRAERLGSGEDSPSSPALPARHPADRDTPVSSPDSTSDRSSRNPSAPPTRNGPDASSTHSCEKTSIISFFRCTYFGIRVTSLIAFTLQVLLISATIALWVTTARRMTQNNQDSPSQSVPFGILVHIIFGIFMVAQVVFFERRIFHIRAERYMYLHPSEILPSTSRRASATYMPLAPWNRPPLPTYAAALAQSGHGTGDVEDHLIAVPPPPAYGNTRGSTLLLAGFLRESLRAQRPSSLQSQVSTRNDRPLSYKSTDEEWETICDAERARRLEETLATLERPRSRSQRTGAM